MLDNLVIDLEKHQNISLIKEEGKNKQGYILTLNNDKEIFLEETERGLYLSSKISHFSEEQIPSLEDFYMYLMKANFLGQGTKDAVISLNPCEKFLTLSTLIAYEVNYKMFFDLLEDFVNYLFFWEKEINRNLNRDK
ncbi:MAG: hypothetical protein S4CHLAM20_07420 [Chlamydiia bacterium]|nr:hypothetical protein [Chlamydiia bacterium]